MRPPHRSPATRRRASGTAAAWFVFASGAVAALTGGGSATPASAGGAGAPRPSFVRLGTAPSLPRAAVRLGPVPAAEPIALDIVLTPRHAARLAALARAVSDPASPQYRHYLRRGEFATTFGATAATLSSLEAVLRSEGLTPTGVSADRLAVRVEAPAGAVEHALATRLTRYRLAGGSQGFANDSAPLVPASVVGHVQALIGLDSLATSAPTGLALGERAVRAPRLAGATPGPAPTSSCAAAAGPAGYTADQIASAYGLGGLYAAGDLGSGVSIGLIEFSPISQSDIAAYAACYGLAYPSVAIEPVDGGPRSAVAANEVEAELDLEDLVGLAPQAKFVVYEGTDAGGSVSGSSAYDTYATAVSQDAVQVISTSWGSCEQAVGAGAADAENTLFEQAALQGQSVVAAAGDEGSEDCYGTIAGARGQALAVDDPASQPYVTAVGGTTLDLGAQPAESVWNTTLHNSSPGAGGGGVSGLWAMPAYQSRAAAFLGVVSARSACAANVGPGRAAVEGAAVAGGDCRQVPDVAANAGAPYAIYCTLGEPTDCAYGGWTGLGGTSAAAPTWAAIFALADASTGCAATGPIGFANPALYAIAASDYAGAFHDVTSGGNDLTGANPGDYVAVPGYDLASGLGTPIAGDGSDNGLVARLCAPSARSAARSQLPAPLVATVRPSTIRARAGVHVTIVGSNFSGATAVDFGRAPALSFKVRSRTSIVAVAPDGAGLVHVTVTTRAGTSQRVRADVFDYLVRPLLYRVAPPSGPARGRTVVLVGAHLNGAMAVLFGPRRALAFSVRSPTRIVAVAPPGHGTVVVTVRTRWGSSAALAADRFRYTAAP